MNNKPVSYLQTDPRWSKLPYQTSRETATIGGSGCGPTCMAMVIATLVDSSVTPVTTCNWSVNHGYKATGNGTYHSYFVPQAAAYGLECIKLNQTSLQYMYASDAKKYHDLAHDYVDDGYMVVSLQGPGLWTSGGHFILWYSNDGDDVLINDPASQKAARTRNTFSKLQEAGRYYWAIKPPEEVICLTNTELMAAIDSAVESKISSILNGEGNVPSDWAKQFWYSACKAGLMDGTRPKGYTTREQIATILTTSGHCPKLDVPTGFDFSKAEY